MSTTAQKVTLFVWFILILYLIFLEKGVLIKYGVFSFVPNIFAAPKETLLFQLSISNFTPFHTIMLYLTNPPTMSIAFKNIVGNILLFVPIGFLTALLSGERRTRTWKWVILVSFSVSFSLEVLQLATFSGVFDVDDLILNVLGGALGLVVFSGFFFLLKYSAK